MQGSRRMDCLNPIKAVGFPDRRCMVCVGCQRYRSWLWTSRARLEALALPHQLFFTLTFRSNKVVRGDEAVAYEEVKKWLKVLRKRQDRLLRYVAFSEKGSSGGRLHFHVLIYSPVKWSRDDYRGARMLWKHGITHVKVASDAMAAYAAKYATKTRGRVRASQGFGTKYFSRVYSQELAKAKLDPVVSAVLKEFPRSAVRLTFPKCSRAVVAPLRERYEAEVLRLRFPPLSEKTPKNDFQR